METVSTLWSADNRFRRDETICRHDFDGCRYYCTANFPEVAWFPSVTSIISRTTPMPDGMKRLLGEKGAEGYAVFMREKAAYGTWMHLLWAQALISGVVDVNHERLWDKLDEYRSAADTTITADMAGAWIERAQFDLLAFAQWVRDYQVKPLACECVLTHPELRYAGCIDLACELTIEEKGFFGEYYKTGARAGEPKETKQERRITAIVDFKSGRSGFFEEYAIQLQAYQILWNANFPDFPIENTFNLAPKDWRTTPSYSFKEQKAARFSLLLQLFDSLDMWTPSSRMEIDGKITLGAPVEDLIRTVRPETLIMERMSW